MGRPERPPLDDESFAWSPEANRKRQALLGLRMTPAQRLRWLETTVAEMRKILGKARKASARPWRLTH
jgi:hypothetical protein